MRSVPTGSRVAPMALDDLLRRRGCALPPDADTSDTSRKNQTYQRKAAPTLGCTADTSETSQNNDAETQPCENSATAQNGRNLSRDLYTSDVSAVSDVHASNSKGSSRYVTETADVSDVSASAHAAWLVRFADRAPLELHYWPAMTLAEVLTDNPGAVGAEPLRPAPAPAPAARTQAGCSDCRHLRRPGRSDGLCASGRDDLMPAYGANHPLRKLPADGGDGCKQFELAKWVTP